MAILTKKKSLIAGLTILFMAVSIPVAVGAQSVRAEEARQNAEERQTTAQETVADRKEEAQTRLADAKLRACQNRQVAVTNIMARIADRGQKQLELFSTIADRTKAFYADKGHVLTGYDELVSEAEAKKTAAQTVVDSVESGSTQFECDGDNPRGVISSFKESLKSEISALNEYKEAVKNLIVGVKSVNSSTATDGEEE